MADGRPGPGYWKQRANYDISVSLDTAANEVSGSETITYTNNSPEPLSHLWLQLDQNLFKDGSRGNDEYDPPKVRWRGAFKNGGDFLKSVAVVQEVEKENISYVVDGTRMIIYLGKLLPAYGGKLDIEISCLRD
jgi:hypothetical protein